MIESPATIFRLLRTMDDEATTRIDGWHAGLCDYAGHLGLTTKRYEVPIYRRLAEMLNGAGYKTRTDVPYPYGSGQECDVVVTLPEGGSIWIEVKQAWKEWFSNRTSSVQTSGFYRGYLLGPGAGGLPRSHSAAQDFEKLEQLRPPEADFVGVLLIAFSRARPVDSELTELSDIVGLPARGWHVRGPDAWPDRNCTACRIVCAFWYRAADAGPISSIAPKPATAPDARPSLSASPATTLGDSGPGSGTNVAAALSWADAHPVELRRKAAEVVRRLMNHERRLKRDGGPWIDSWTWEQAVSEILGVPEDVRVVRMVGQQLRVKEQPYIVEHYDDPWRFGRLLDHLEQVLAEHTPAY